MAVINFSTKIWVIKDCKTEQRLKSDEISDFHFRIDLESFLTLIIQLPLKKIKLKVSHHR